MTLFLFGETVQRLDISVFLFINIVSGGFIEFKWKCNNNSNKIHFELSF